MTSKKKATIRGTIIFILILAIGFASFYIYTGSSRKYGNPVEVENAVLLKEDIDPLTERKGFCPWASDYEDILNVSGDYKYVMFKDEDNKVNAYAVSESEISDYLNNLEVAEAAKEIVQNKKKHSNLLNVMEGDAKVIIENLQTEAGTTIWNDPYENAKTLLGYDESAGEFTDFGGQCIESGCGLAEAIKKQGTVFYIENVEVKKIIIDEETAGFLYNAGAVVQAEITTVKRDGIYKSLSWVPLPGQTKTISFIINYCAYEINDSNVICVNDIGVVRPCGFVEHITNLFK